MSFNCACRGRRRERREQRDQVNPQGELMINKPMVGVAAAVLLVAGGSWYYLQSRQAAAPSAPAAVQTPLPPEPSEEPATQHPLPAGPGGSASQAPLPALADSDAALRDALGQLAGAAAVKDYLRPESIVRHLVVTVDNLPRQKVSVEKRPIVPIPG